MVTGFLVGLAAGVLGSVALVVGAIAALGMEQDRGAEDKAVRS